jgi:hypothetical protein
MLTTPVDGPWRYNMEQLQLLLRDQQKFVSVEIIESCKAFLDAIKLSISISGLEGKQIAGQLNIDAGQWSRILTGDANFPLNKLMDFMELCKNKVPLIWLAVKCGYVLTPMKSEQEVELDAIRAERDKYKEQYDHAIEVIKAVKAA